MAPPPNLPAALLHHAAADPEEPWLFRAEGWDWSWHPWGEAARRLTAWTERLSALPPGTRAAFRDRSHPDTVVLDLAIQAAGLVSAPRLQGERGGRGVDRDRGGTRSRSSPPASPRLETPGGVTVRIADADVVWTSAELVAAGERLRGEIGEPGRPRDRRARGAARRSRRADDDGLGDARRRRRGAGARSRPPRRRGRLGAADAVPRHARRRSRTCGRGGEGAARGGCRSGGCGRCW